MIGQTLGHYRIIEKIGAGGMGVVYRARDERLERDVALKVLPSGTVADEAARKRFRKEALALSQLNHPNIETVHDFDMQEGTDFLVMELIPGVSLDERLAAELLREKEIAHLGTQLAEALAAAHGQGVVHRDLKPGNLRVTPDGRLKVLDFGLAVLLQPASQTASTRSITETSAVAGTLPYMPPEQLLAEKVDARSDIWAAGAVLYEMASGQRPFREEVAVRLVDAILHQAPMPPRKVNARISPELERIILKCLEKDPENRYQSAKELAVDLRRLGLPTSAATMPSRLPRSRRWSLAVVGALAALLAVLVGLNVGELRDAVWSRVSGRAKPARIESLAVLPLENLARDPSQDYFADGMTEALIAALARIGALRVISRTSVMQYRGAKKPLPQIAKELGVDAVIEGSVLREGDQVRIAVQLIHGPTDRHLWANSYQRELRSILTLQSEVARAIADEIKVKLTPQEQARLASARPVNPEVYESYLRGRYDLDRRSAEAARQALRHFEHALGIDPTHAPSYAALADAYMVLGTGFIAAQPATEARPKGKVAAMKALEIDPGLAEAHAALGATYLCYDWDWAAAEAELRRATELNARYAPPHQWYALLYSAMGRFDDALAAARRAQEFDPLAPSASVYTPRVLYYARRYDQAREALGKVLDLDPDFILAHFWLGRCFVAQSVRERAISELRTAVNLSGRGPVMLAALAHGYAVTGQGAEARKLLGELNELSKQRYVPSYNIAEVYAGLGERDRAFEWLEKALVERTDLLIWLKVDPVWDGLRPDARFQNLLRRIGLPL